MTNLPNSEQSGNLDNIAVTRAEFRSEIGILLEYVAQALGSVTGTYTTQVVDPFDPELQGTPTLEIGAEPDGSDSSLRLVTSQWVKRSGRYFGNTAPNNPVDGMLWIDNSTNPYTIQAFNGTGWDLVGGVPSSTRMLFQQSSAPLGWTRDLSNDNAALRVTAGAVTTGGTLDFTAAFSDSIESTGTVQPTALTTAQMPVHSHAVTDPGHSHTATQIFASRTSYIGGPARDNIPGSAENCNYKAPVMGSSATGISLGNNGSGETHTHGFTGGSINLDVKYVDIIVAEKD